MSSVYFYLAILTFCLGVGIQTVWPVSLSVILLCLLISLGVALIWRRNHLVISAPFVLLGSITLCAFAVGLIRTELFSWQFGGSPLQGEVGNEISFSGVVTAEPDVRERSVLIQVVSDTDKLQVSTDRLTGVSYGDEVLVTGVLKQPESFTTELGREFDYVGYLKAKHIEYTISFAQVEVLSNNNANPFIGSLLALKRTFMDKLELVLPEPQVGLSEGLLLGVKQALGDDVEEDFRRTGIIHIVVLSGYNVMLVVAFFLYCFSFFLRPKQRVVGGVVAITAFALLVGLSATVVRASIMACLLLFAQGFGHTYNVMRALCFAGAVMLLLNPYLLLYDIGFQLSFMATLGLLLLTPHFEASFVRLQSIRFTDFLLSTIATQIAVLPLLLFHIGEFSLVSLVVNVLVLPVVPVAMLLTFVTGVLGFVSVTLSSAVSFLAYLSLTYILLVAQWFASLPFATVVIPEFPWMGVLVLYALLATGLLYLLLRKGVHSVTADWVIEDEQLKTPTHFSKEKPVGVSEDTLPKIFR